MHHVRTRPTRGLYLLVASIDHLHLPFFSRARTYRHREEQQLEVCSNDRGPTGDAVAAPATNLAKPRRTRFDRQIISPELQISLALQC
jgi:hypothetical protein